MTPVEVGEKKGAVWPVLEIRRICKKFSRLVYPLSARQGSIRGMWPDNETVDDLIGFRVHSELIAEVVIDTKLLPITMGVFGDWGNGKTSIMKMLEAELEKRDDIAVLYFDAWLFEGYDDAKSALISSIIKQLADHRSFPQALKKQAATLLARVNWMRVMKMGATHVAIPAVLAYMTGGATAVPGLIGAIKGIFSSTTPSGVAETLTSENVEGLLNESEEKAVTEIRDFRDGFENLLKETPFKALVVLIDDLDRCSPERIVENLEAIKLFLNVKGTAFVIGADPRIVSHAIAVRYKNALDAAKAAADTTKSGEDAGKELVRDYVEKLIQLPYHLPRLSPSEIETYMTLLFAQRDLSAEDFKLCVSACDTARAANRFKTFGQAELVAALGKPIPEGLQEALSFTSGAASMFAENLKGNPRQIKRFLNAFTLRRKLSKVAKMDTLRDAVLLKLMLLEYSHEEEFKAMALWHQAQNATPQQILDMEGDGPVSPGWDKDNIQRWLKMEPKFKGVDLSDYFWLVRDKLASSLVGVTMLAPNVKTAYTSLITEMGRKKAKPLLEALTADEIQAVTELLDKLIHRDPSEAEGYNGFHELVTVRQEAMPAYCDLVKLLPADKLPAWVSSKFKLLGTTYPALKPQAEALLATLAKAPGKAGAAAKTRTPSG